jgi:methionine sulfoxide reductase heme-binding subunit
LLLEEVELPFPCMTLIRTLSVQKWQIVGWTAIGVSLTVGVVWMTYGFGEIGMRIAIRLTARSSCLLFLLAFISSALAALWPVGWAQWLRSNRRYLGLSFAVSHAWHAIAIFGLALISSGKAISYSPGGMLGYLFIGAMAATSSNRAKQQLGNRFWYTLHAMGAYYLWLAFLISFGKRWSVSPIYPFMTGLLVIAMALRIFRWINREATIQD